MTNLGELGDDELLTMSVLYGRKSRPLISLINDWARSVLTYRSISVGPEGFNPGSHTPDDFVGALFLRQAIDDGLRSQGKDSVLLPILAATDELHMNSTAPDPKGFVVQLAAGPHETTLVRSGWWWHRYPARGALFEPARRWYLENGFAPPTS